jgi:hypothetical protein
METLYPIFAKAMKTAQQPTIRQASITLILLIGMAAFVQVQNVQRRQAQRVEVSGESNSNSQMIQMESAEEKNKQVPSFVERYSGIITLPATIMRSVRRFSNSN